MSNTSKAHLYLFISAALFGANYLVSKNLMPHPFTPYQMGFIRLSGAAIIFIILGLVKHEKVAPKDLMMLAVCSLFGVALNQLFFFMGINYSTPITASVIHTSSPILIVIFASILIGEMITLKKFIGIAIGITGALLIILQGQDFSLHGNMLKGNIFLFTNIAAYSVYVVLIKPLMAKYNIMTIMCWVSVFGLLYITPFTVSEVPSIQWHSLEVKTWLSLAYLIIGMSVIAYLLVSAALKHVEASVVGYYIYLQPVFASLIAIVTGTGSLSVTTVISALLIFSGVYLVSQKRVAKTNLKKTV